MSLVHFPGCDQTGSMAFVLCRGRENVVLSAAYALRQMWGREHMGSKNPSPLSLELSIFTMALAAYMISDITLA